MWILIVFMFTGSSSVYHVEFGSQKACNDAKTVVYSTLGTSARDVKLFCFPKD